MESEGDGGELKSRGTIREGSRRQLLLRESLTSLLLLSLSKVILHLDSLQFNCLNEKFLAQTEGCRV